MEPGEQLEILFRRWKFTALLQFALQGLAVAILLAALLKLWLPPGTGALVATGMVAWIAAVALFCQRSGWFQAKPVDLSYFLNRNYPELEDSADLLTLSPDELAPLAALQRRRIADRLQTLDIRLPVRTRQALFTLLISGAFSWGLLYFSSESFASGRKSGPGPPDVFPVEEVFPGMPGPVELRSFSVTVQPPRYTGIKASKQRELDIEAPAGSTIRWTMSFSTTLKEGRLTTGDGREFSLQKEGDGRFTVSLPVTRTTFYSLSGRAENDEWTTSGFYRLEVIPDEPPRIEVEDLPQYAEYPFDPDKEIRFTTRVTDDYGVSNARIIATVSSGEGESVKFRDDTLYFGASFQKRAKDYELNKTLRLGDLQMGRGDELYLHIEALDNRNPDPQISKTFKYIIAFENPEAITLDMAGGLAVNRLPEYFRSQRQIIIDTEKLIALEKQLSKTDFQEQSNNIAIDQKLLRLRYGRFLGEEFQSVIGEMPGAETDEDHEHAEEDDHEAHEHEHEHDDHNPLLQSEDSEIAELEPYYHAHDITEEVTFFDATTTAKLRVALAQMWDAELHLRLGRPRDALPYEYKALKLIKEIQQASRIYVERVGFEPPTINVAEKRLSGELDKILSPRINRDKKNDFPYPAIEAAAPILEGLRLEQRPADPDEYARLQAAGEELAALAVEQPGAYLNALQQLRFIMENEVPSPRREEYLRELQRIFWSLLPELESQPSKAQAGSGALREKFLEEIQRGRE